MSQQDETPGGGSPGASEGNSSSRPNAPEVSPSPDQKQELPLVTEARARDALARARLRGLIPEKMAKLESGKRWERAEKLRATVFGPPKSDGGE